MPNIKPFLVTKPESGMSSADADVNAFSDAFSTPLSPHDTINVSEEDLKLLRDSATSDSTRLIRYFDPILHKKQKVFERQVKAVEEIAVSSENHARNSQQVAESAKVISNIASAKAKKADIKSWIAIGISLSALIVEIIINRAEFISFLQSLTF